MFKTGGSPFFFFFYTKQILWTPRGIQASFFFFTNFWFYLGAMQTERLNDVADGSSNVREVWKFSFK
jgi:hypothetical protein